MKTSKIKNLLKGRKIVKIIRTLTLIIVVCVNCILIIKPDTSLDTDKGKAVNACEFHVEEMPINAAEFHILGGE